MGVSHLALVFGQEGGDGERGCVDVKEQSLGRMARTYEGKGDDGLETCCHGVGKMEGGGRIGEGGAEALGYM